MRFSLFRLVEAVTSSSRAAAEPDRSHAARNLTDDKDDQRFISTGHR
jgi:hypothetical protein